MEKPKVAVHKFSSCDGCQLAFLNAGEALVTLSELVDIVHFAEAGNYDPEMPVDIAFVEGSVTTPREFKEIQKIRENSSYLITIGACATSGGLQALRNLADVHEWMSHVYASPEYIETLDTSTPISKHVIVDLELWGCPVTTHQVMQAVRSLLFNAIPHVDDYKVCIECKRRNQVCVLVTEQAPCMGPVTKTGCGAICPKYGRACYACFGPAENVNTVSLQRCFSGFGLLPDTIKRQFTHINSEAKAFKKASETT